MIYRKIYPGVPFGCEPRSRILVVDENGNIPGDVLCMVATVADAAANGMIAALQERDAEQEHVRLHTIGDEVVEIGTGSGEGE